MAGPKTHRQEQRIIEERVNTNNADKDFPAEEELKRDSQQRKGSKAAEDRKSGRDE